MFENIFCLPQKYPLIIDDTLIKGTVIDKHIIGIISSLFLRRLAAKKGEIIIVIIIMIIPHIIDNGIKDNNKFFELLLLSDITFDIAVGKEKVAITVNKDEVGDNKLNSPIPSVFKYLVIIIFNMNPTSLPSIPPNNNTKVDFKNKLFLILFNIINYMILFN